MTPIYILIALLVIGWAVLHFSSRRALNSACELRCAGLQREFQRQIDALTASVRALDQKGESTRVAGPANAEALPAQAAPAGDEITPEILRSITEVIAALLGRKVRILSVKILQTPESTLTPWAQHGRAVIQASHNLVQRGRE